jgi:hypothetical protein
MKKLAIALALVLCAAAPAAAQFGKNKIAYDKFDWKVYRSTHFAIYFYPSEQVSLGKVTSYAESAYDEISRSTSRSPSRSTSSTTPPTRTSSRRTRS